MGGSSRMFTTSNRSMDSDQLRKRRRIAIQRIFTEFIEERNGIRTIQRREDVRKIQDWNAAKGAKEEGSFEEEEDQFEEKVIVEEEERFEKEDCVEEKDCNKEEDGDKEKEFVEEEEFLQKEDGDK